MSNNSNTEEKEFDAFASNYDAILNDSIAAFGEESKYFTEYKIKDLARAWYREESDSAKPVTILDFGSGIGTSIPFIHKHFSNVQITCADVSRESLAIAKRTHGDAATYSLIENNRLLLPDESFDVVFAACVFHHILPHDQPMILKELHRVLRSDGILMIYEHNPYNPLVNRVVKACPFDKNAVLIPPYVMTRRVTQATFRKIRSRYRVFFPNQLKALRSVEAFLTWLPIGAQYYTIAKK